jgi:hypothetical protein
MYRKKDIKLCPTATGYTDVDLIQLRKGCRGVTLKKMEHLGFMKADENQLG